MKCSYKSCLTLSLNTAAEVRRKIPLSFVNINLMLNWLPILVPSEIHSGESVLFPGNLDLGNSGLMSECTGLDMLLSLATLTVRAVEVLPGDMGTANNGPYILLCKFTR